MWIDESRSNLIFEHIFLCRYPQKVENTNYKLTLQGSLQGSNTYNLC